MKHCFACLLSAGMSIAAGAQMPAAAMDNFQIPSHGFNLNAFAYIASGDVAHPVIVLLHGIPGNERNLDIAQDVRRTGWDVVYFDYRGSWGTPGDFSFSHCIEDVAAVMSYLRRPEVAKRLRLDPARIALVGHSMGGFVALQEMAEDPKILGMAMISGVDLVGQIPPNLPREYEQKAVEGLSKSLSAQGLSPLAGCTPQGLAQEVVDHSTAWSWVSKVRALESRPVLVITSNDGFARGGDALVTALKKAHGESIETVHLATDHTYSGKRLELSAILSRWLTQLQ